MQHQIFFAVVTAVASDVEKYLLETGSSSSSLESSILCSNFDMSITNITVADDIDKTSSLGTLIIESSTGWLDCVIIHQAQVY